MRFSAAILALLSGLLLTVEALYVTKINQHLKCPRWNMKGLNDYLDDDSVPIMTESWTSQSTIRYHAPIRNIPIKLASLGFLVTAIIPVTSSANAAENVAELQQEEKVEDMVKFAAEMEDNRALNSDEFIVNFSNPGLGLVLVETYHKGFPVVTVKDVRDRTGLSDALIPGVILVKVNGDKVDGLPLKTISDIIKRTSERPLRIKFRDPSKYFQLLDSTVGAPRKIITTSYLPANTRDEGAPEQIIRVERLAMPPSEQRIRPAQMLDVMEIQYAAQVLKGGGGIGDDSPVVDSSATRSAPGTSAKSIYYILGQQNGPPGTKLPPGWDLTLTGMVVGEKRRITLPYTLGYDRKVRVQALTTQIREISS